MPFTWGGLIFDISVDPNLYRELPKLVGALSQRVISVLTVL